MATHRRLTLIMISSALLLGVSVLLYRHFNLPAASFVRNYLGDIAAVIFVYYLIKLFTQLADWKLAIITFCVALSIECGQLWWGAIAQDNTVSILVIGTSFDWLDIVMYLTGVLISLGISYKLIWNAAD